ncbi:MAG: hypothetical protein ACI841_003330 [Planctomycetota bacterium]|jgi:hypothetical protein
MRRILIGIVLVAALVWTVGAVRFALASPEERIRMRIDRMAIGFNTTKMAGVLGGFAHEYRDDDQEIDRDRVKEILLYLFFREIDPLTKRFRLRVEVPEPEFSVELDGADRSKAVVNMRAVFYERDGDSEELYWDARVTADMVEGEDGWQLLRTRKVNHSDRKR